MKKVVWTLGLLFLLPHSSLAQETTQFYYPLNDGDVFQYHFDFGSFFVGTETRKVAGDTLMPNGKTYRKIESDIVFYDGTVRNGTIHMRVSDEDSVFLYLNPIEILLFPLNLNVGLTWPIDDYAFHEITAISDTTLLGGRFPYVEVATISSQDSTLLWSPDFLLADTLGVIYDPGEGGGSQLTGAVINGKQYGLITAVKARERSQQALTALNYPNPFNHSTRISYTLNSPKRVRIQIFNILGKEVQSYDVGVQQAGTHTRVWDGDDHRGISVSSGLYYYLIKSESQTLYKGSMTFLK